MLPRGLVSADSWLLWEPCKFYTPNKFFSLLSLPAWLCVVPRCAESPCLAMDNWRRSCGAVVCSLPLSPVENWPCPRPHFCDISLLPRSAALVLREHIKVVFSYPLPFSSLMAPFKCPGRVLGESQHVSGHSCTAEPRVRGM